MHLTCQQVMKQECQSTGESKSGQKEGRRKFATKKAIAVIGPCDEICGESVQQTEFAKKEKKNIYIYFFMGWWM